MSGGLKRGVVAVGLAVALAVAVGGGYWVGTQRAHEGAAVTAAALKGERRVLYYRHPMGLPDTSPVPKKDPMGMDYIPVYEGEEQDSANQAGETGVAISPDKVQKLGVSFATVERVTISRPVRAVGKIEVDERRQAVVAPKFEGWIEVLHVNTTGQPVRRGQPLLEVYSPELVSAQREFLLAQQSRSKMTADSELESGMRSLADASLARMRNWDISDDDVRSLRTTGTPTRTLTLRAPAGGIVIEKTALQGMRFMPGEMLFKIADLSSVWVIGEVFEQELALVRIGHTAQVRVNAYPDRRFAGRVAYIYPTVKAETRTAQVRIELPNPGLLLKPSMYAEVEIAAGEKANVLAIPSDAALTTGTRSVVLVARDAGRFEPREVVLGMRSDNQVEVLSGLREGERVVASANFLIDAESNLRSALGGIGGHGGGAHGGAAPGAAAAGAGAAGKISSAPARHGGEGTVTEIDAKGLRVTISHDPIPSLKWPAMEMPFPVGSTAVLAGVKPGQRVRFDLETKGDGFVITRMLPLSEARPAPAHKGH